LLLMNSYHHGGGFFYAANLAWYGGWITYLFSILGLVYFVYLFEKVVAINSIFTFGLYFFCFMLFVVGLFYGVQPLLRALEIGVIGVVFARYFLKQTPFRDSRE
jgi:hypothetical protein